MLLTGGVVVVVLAVVAAMVLIFVLKGDKKNADLRIPAAQGVVDDVTKVPAASFANVGTSGVTSPPSKIPGAPVLTANGKPEVFYYGAEFCPYCAAERWSVVAALSRFGTFSNLSTTTSASQDVFPSTPTFSFYQSSYTSQYLTFTPVETTTNQRKGDDYETLEKATDAQTALVAKYDVDPSSGRSGSIPFIDFGNKFKISGATYDPSVLQGKSLDEIAAAVKDTGTPVSKGVLGSANQITAAVCEITGGKPSDVCDAPNITALRTALNSGS